MKETMYSGTDSLDDSAVMVWACGDQMLVLPHDGDLLNPSDLPVKFNDHKWEYAEPLDLSRFTDLTVVWER